MDQNLLAETVKDFLRTCLEPFSPKDFQQFLKKNKLKFSLDDIRELLTNADYVFPLINDRFLTYAGAFTGLWFSFKPTREEVENGLFVVGHRFMPFFDMGEKGYNATIVFGTKEVEQESGRFSMNTALDLFAFFGEGYTIPTIMDDPACDNFSFSSVQYGLPPKVNLTGFSLEPYFEQGFEYGDRILCRILDWDQCIVDTQIKKEKHKDLKFSFADMAQEEWFSLFEEKMLEKIEKHGPCASIERQLALLFLEEQTVLCNQNCGSIEEFTQHSSKIGISNFGMESRIWRYKEEVPFIGDWNRNLVKTTPFPCIALLSSDHVISSFIKDMLFRNEPCEVEDLCKKLYPKELIFSDFEEEFLMLHLKKRIDIVKSSYNKFVDFPIAGCRHRVLLLFKSIMTMAAKLTHYAEKLESFPQAELVILVQMAEHTSAFLEEMEYAQSQAEAELEDLSTSLTGMADGFEAIEDTLLGAIRTHKNN